MIPFVQVHADAVVWTGLQLIESTMAMRATGE